MSVANAIAGKLVTPGFPQGRSAKINHIELGESEPERDVSSSWAGFMTYTNAKGETTDRRIVVLQIEGAAKAELIAGRCIETNRFKRFRIDRISELVCCETGEILDAFEHFESLRLHGALKINDKMLTDISRMLMFLAKCDGNFHPLEVECFEDAITKYIMRFGGSDRTLESALKNSANLAPDDMDFVKALDRIRKHDQARNLSRLILECSSDIVDADGMHHAEEIRWAVEISNSLKQIATS